MNGIETAKKVLAEKFAVVVSGIDVYPMDSSLAEKMIQAAGITANMDEAEIEQRLTSIRSGGFGSPETRIAKLSPAFLSEMEKIFKVSAEPQALKAPRRFFR